MRDVYEPEMAGKTDQFVRLFAANQRRIYGFITVMVPKATEADDVFQEVSVGLWRKFDGFTPGTDFVAWALQFARYAVLKHYEAQRRKNRLVFQGDVLDALVDEATIATGDADRRHEALRRCLDKLPQRSRELVHVQLCLNFVIAWLSPNLWDIRHPIIPINIFAVGANFTLIRSFYSICEKVTYRIISVFCVFMIILLLCGMFL
jgi:RNA polymerase sigma-70 factor (ECF subfamily)